MSALTVIFNQDKKPVDLDLLKQMTDPVKHLGPDGIHYLIKGHIGFASLASHITPESSHEQQPLESEDNRFVLAADARIDNRGELLNELREQLPRKDIITDADLILASYRKWNHNSPAHLIGDFAFVIWDKIEQQLFAAVDALGMRNLYYSQIGNTLCLATEALQILEHPGSDNQLSELALASWMINRPDPNISMFEKVPLLPGGTYLLIKPEQSPKTCLYWQPAPHHRIRYRQISEYEEHLREILSRSIQDRMRTNKTIIAADLSGGMDSSTVVGLGQQIAESQHKRLVTISQTFSTLNSCDETEYINATINHLGIENIQFDAEQYGTKDYPEAYAPLLFSPFHLRNPVFDHTLTLAEEAGANVLLTGHGGDELTAGSQLSYLERVLHGDLHSLLEAYRAAKRNKTPLSQVMRHVFIVPLIPDSLRRTIYRIKGKVISPPWPPWIPDAKAEQLKLRNRYYSTSSHFTSRAQNAMWDYLHSSANLPILSGIDHVTIPKGIELRHPFLDRRLAEFSLSIPPALWRRNGFSKWLLRRALQSSLPEKVCWRHSKTFFNARFTDPIRQKRNCILNILTNNTLSELGLFKQDIFREYIMEKTSDPTYNFGVDTSRMLAIHMWHRHWFEHYMKGVVK